MRYLMFGDPHGKSLIGLEPVIERVDPAVIMCLGDFDFVSVIREFMDIEKRLKGAGKEVIAVPGNHDYCIAVNREVFSATLMNNMVTINELHEKLQRATDAKSYIERVVEDEHSKSFYLDPSRFGESFPAVIVHGGYNGNLRSMGDCPDEMKDLWYRLECEDDHRKNFDAMKKNGKRIMIRGHEHIAEFAQLDGENLSFEEAEAGDEYRLEPDKLYTITVGAFFENEFTVIDTKGDVPVVRFERM